MTKRYEEPPLDLELAECLKREDAATAGLIRLVQARERFHERLRKHESTKDQAPPPSAA